MIKTRQDVAEPDFEHCELIEIRITELTQLFNPIDASPFGKRDLDPDAEEFIVGWAHEAPRGAKLGLLVNLERDPPPTNTSVAGESAALREALRDFFTHRAKVARRRLRSLLRIGRMSLSLGLVFLVAAVGLGNFVASVMSGQRLGDLLREGLVICGWVAMWRPLEMLLYDWWPIRKEAQLFDRLSAMPVRIAYKSTRQSGAKEVLRADGSPVPSVLAPRQQSPPHGEQTIAQGKSVWRNEGNPN